VFSQSILIEYADFPEYVHAHYSLNFYRSCPVMEEPVHVKIFKNDELALQW